VRNSGDLAGIIGCEVRAAAVVALAATLCEIANKQKLCLN
jgi:hypothetical protein